MIQQTQPKSGDEVPELPARSGTVDVGATLGPVEVELRGDADAVARFNMLATGGSGGLLPERGQVYAVETGWRRVDGEWRLRSARWQAGGARG